MNSLKRSVGGGCRVAAHKMASREGRVAGSAGAALALLWMIRKILSKKNHDSEVASKAPLSEILSESPELLQVAMDQGIPLSELYGEPATAEAEDNSGHISSLPAASAGVIEHPDVKNADGKLAASRTLKKLDEPTKDLLRSIVQLRSSLADAPA